MTGPEHYREAERLIDGLTVRDVLTGKRHLARPGDHSEVLAPAQVHATLALAAEARALAQAAEMRYLDGEEWEATAGLPGKPAAAS